MAELTDEQRRALDRLVTSGRESARKIIRARVLLMADDGADDGEDDGETDGDITDALGVGVRTAERVRRRFAGGGSRAAGRTRSGPPSTASRSRPGRPSGCWTGRPRRG